MEKICKNCKHWKYPVVYGNGYGIGKCELIEKFITVDVMSLNGDHYVKGLETDIDFGCNKFEKE